jgi:hypothetical protein
VIVSNAATARSRPSPAGNLTRSCSVPRSAPRGFWFLLAFSALICLWGVYETRAYLMDDALITLRYSYNLAAHGVPFWNQADVTSPSMGYTSILWMAINAVPALVTGNRDILVDMAKFFSLVSLMVIVWLVSRSVFSLSMSTPPKFLIALLLFSQFGHGLHVNSAMETMLFSCVLLLAVKAYAERHYSFAYVFGALSFLTRPEGAIVVALLCGWDLWRRQVRRAVVAAVLFTGLVAGTLVLLHHWYGDVLPNTFYAKQGLLNPGAIKRTVFFIASLAIPFLVMSVYAAFWIRDRTSRYMLVTASVYILYYVSVDPLMNVLSRYQWPSLVMLTFASLPAFQFLFGNPRRHPAAIAILVSSLIVLNVANGLGASYFADATGHWEKNSVLIGKEMAKHRDPERWLVHHDAGAICYYSDWNTYETVGLTNRQIARRQMRESDIYRRANAEVVLHNFDLTRHEGQVAEFDYSNLLSKYGYRHVRDLPVLFVPGQRNAVIAVFSRDTSFADSVFDGIELPAMQPSLSYRFYELTKRVVKGN